MTALLHDAPSDSAIESSDHAIQPIDPTSQITHYSAIATALADVVRRQGWSLPIQGKEYVRLEGWQMLATLLGVTPFVEWTRRVDRDDHYIYEARAIIRRVADGAVVAAGEGLCSSIERTKTGLRWRDEFAVRAMAQTRAVARALRLAFGGVMALGGYAPTPAEEMVLDDDPSPPPAPQSRTSPPADQQDESEARKKAYAAIYAVARERGMDNRRVHEIAADRYGVASLRDLTMDQLRDLYRHISAQPIPPPAQATLPPSPPPPPPKTGWSAWIEKHRNHIVLGSVIDALERRHIDADDLCTYVYGASAPATDEQSQAIIEDLAARWAQYAASYQSQSQEA